MASGKRQRIGSPRKAKRRAGTSDDCVHTHPIPPSEIQRYSVERDPDAEKDVAIYVEWQARPEKVQHVERIKSEYVMGVEYEMWDVTTDKQRWWVISNLTNLYSQAHFPSLDYTLSFHIGLMLRLQSKQQRLVEEAAPFDEIYRRREQAEELLDGAREAEEYQAVGMQLRECLVSLVMAMQRRVELPEGVTRPNAADFRGWSNVLMDRLCPGESNKELRSYLKNIAEKTWQLVNWITHDRNANQAATSIALHSCDIVFGHFIQMLTRDRTDHRETCPRCSSRRIRQHFDRAIGADGDYYATCGECDWSNHPQGSARHENAS
jgi:hypothetical protein